MFFATVKKTLHSLLGKKPDPFRRMSAEEINSLPLQGYEGEIRVVRDHESLLKAVTDLRQEELLGFDTETRPSFWKGKSYPPALIQLAGRETVSIFQLGLTGLPEELRGLLAEKTIIKAGVALHNDLKELRKIAGFKPAGFVELGELALQKGLQNHGLRGMAAVLLGFRIPKGNVRKSNWAKENLSQAQIRYAATDAWVGRELYLRLREL